MFDGRGGVAGGGSSLDPGMIAGLATEAWTEENYVSKTFFNELFVIHKKTTTTVYDGTTVVSTTVDTSGTFAPNEIPSQEESTDTETGYRTVVVTEVDNIEAKKGLWTDFFLSALGLNAGGGGGGIGDVTWQALGDQLDDRQIASSHLTTALNNALVGYATQSWVTAQNYVTSSAISDMATKTWVNNQSFVNWTALGDSTTTQQIALSHLTTALSGYATQNWVTSNFSTPSTVATQLQTYAKIQNGTITIGDTSLTPITSVTGTFWGKSFTNGGTVNGTIKAGSSGGAIEQFHSVEMNSAGTLAGYGGFIDFHYYATGTTFDSTLDYTSRIIESSVGVISIMAKNNDATNANRLAGLLVGAGFDGSYVQIGDLRIVYDSTNNALKVVKIVSGSEVAANFYATGSVSALGYGSGGGGGTGDVTWTNLADNTDTRQIALSHLTGALAGYATTSQLAGYLPLTGGTLSKTNILGDTGLLNIVSTNISPNIVFAYSLMCMCSGLGTGKRNAIALGKEFYNKRCAVLSYSHNNNDGTGNYLSFGMFDVNDVLTIHTNGNVGVGMGVTSVVPSEKLYVNGNIYANGQVKLPVATGTSPFVITSTTVNTNLNADLLDGKHASDFAAASALGNYLPLTGGTLTQSILPLESGVLNINSTTANSWSYSIMCLCSGMVTNRRNAIAFGKSFEQKNCAIISYFHAADNSNSNILSFGLHSVNNVFNIFANGNVAIGVDAVTAPSYKLHVNGSIYGSSFVKANGISTQFLKADGSVDSNVYITSSGSCAYATSAGSLSTTYYCGNVAISQTSVETAGPTFREAYIKGASSGGYAKVWVIENSTSTLIRGYIEACRNTYGNYIGLFNYTASIGIWLGNMNTNAPVFVTSGGTNQYAMWHEGNDGSGSGLDADLLDGQHGNYYAAASSLNDYLPLSGGILTSNSSTPLNLKSNGVDTFLGFIDKDNNVLGYYEVKADHNPYFYYNGNTYKIWNEGNDGSSSGLDADLLDGQHASYYATAASLANYLPLTGGTINGSVGLTVNRSGSAGEVIKIEATEASYSCINFKSGTYNWSVGLNTSNIFYFYNSRSASVLTSLDSYGKLTTVSALLNQSTLPTESGVLNINSTTASSWSYSMMCMCSGMSTGCRNAIAFGKSFGSKYCGIISYYYAGQGSNNNILSFGFHSVNNVFNIFANGNVAIGVDAVTAPSYKLHVNGTFYASNTATFGSNVVSGTSGGAIEGFQSWEINTHGTAGTNIGGFLDFHYNGTAQDYSVRLIERDYSGVLQILAKDTGTGNAQRAGLIVGEGTYTSFIQIGNGRIVWNDSDHALRIVDKDGNACNLYATGGISALGYQSGGGGGGSTGVFSTSITPETTGTYDLGTTTYKWRNLYLAGTTAGGNGLSIITNYSGRVEILSVNYIKFGSGVLFEENIGIGYRNSNYDLYVDGETGNGWFAGTVTQQSDIRRKDVISNINLSIQQIASAPAFRFRFKDERKNKRIMIGTSAQYWDAVLPESVTHGTDDVLGFDYGVTALVSTIILAKGMTEHERRITKLEMENAELRARIKDLEEQ
jgi:hypothetical protein